MENGQLTYPKRLFLEDGTEVRLVPLEKIGGKPLYISKDGKGYSYAHGHLRKINYRILDNPAHRRLKHSTYLEFRNHNHIQVHHAVLEAWGFPRPAGYQCDHINGNTFDNRLENLEWVTRAENIRRRWELNASRGLSYMGKKLTELGKHALRERGKHRKQWKLVQLTLEFPAR